MKIIQQSAKILAATPNALRLIERAGRTCYQSETRGNTEDFIRMIIGRKHESVLEHASATVLFVCDRGVTHELVRHRLASFSQESTRYCNYSHGKFSKQITVIQPDMDPVSLLEWKHACLECEIRYLALLKRGCSPQMARHVLPTSLKAEIVVTANFREWRHIFNMRTAKAAHPHMRHLMISLMRDFVKRWEPAFGDLDVDEYDS